MSLQGFQAALAALIADAGLCRATQADVGDALAGYELTARERRRLAAMAAQRGMTTSCMLYRVNRLTPLQRLLPLSLAVLGADLRPTIDRFWQACPRTNLQFLDEATGFAGFLKAGLADGSVAHPFLEEVLDFELACCRLLLPEGGRTSSFGLEARPAGGTDGGSGWVLHPRIRVVAFRHDPELVLRLAAERDPMPDDLPVGEHYLLLDRRDRGLRVRRVALEAGRRLAAIAGGCFRDPAPPDVLQTGLAAAGLVTATGGGLSEACRTPSRPA